MIIVPKLSTLDISGGPGYSSDYSSNSKSTEENKLNIKGTSLNWHGSTKLWTKQ